MCQEERARVAGLTGVGGLGHALQSRPGFRSAEFIAVQLQLEVPGEGQRVRTIQPVPCKKIIKEEGIYAKEFGTTQRVIYGPG